MKSRIFLQRQGIQAFLPIVTVALILAGCGKSQSNETGAPGASVASPRATFTADPNPVIVTTDTAKLGETSLKWSSTITQSVEIHVGKPDGVLFCKGGGAGSCTTGQWVTDGMTFYLQDSAVAKPTDAAATLAAVTVRVQ